MKGIGRKFNVELFLICFILLAVIYLSVGCTESRVRCTDDACSLEDFKKVDAFENSGEKIYISMISKGEQHQFWISVKEGATKAALDYNVDMTFEGPPTENDVEAQVDMLKLALNRKTDVICLAAIDTEAVLPYVEQAVEQGIPVIGFDSGIESDLITTCVCTDDFDASSFAADKMAELIDGRGDIAVLSHSECITNRVDGFKQGMEKYPNIKIIEVAYSSAGVLESTLRAKKLLTEHPNLKGVFATNEGTSVGVVNAVKELGKEGNVSVVGFDSGILQLQAIRDGVESGAITQNPVAIGYKTIEAAMKIVHGESLEKVIDTGYYWYDQSNIDDETIRSVLYE